MAWTDQEDFLIIQMILGKLSNLLPLHGIDRSLGSGEGATDSSQLALTPLALDSHAQVLELSML